MARTVAGILVSVGLLCVAVAAHAQAPVYVLDLKGTVDVGSGDYIERGLAQAREAGASLVVLRMDTPGGLVTSTRERSSGRSWPHRCRSRRLWRQVGRGQRVPERTFSTPATLPRWRRAPMSAQRPPWRSAGSPACPRSLREGPERPRRIVPKHPLHLATTQWNARS